MSVDLRGLDAGVPEHLLNQTQVGAAGQEMGCKTVSQAVGADIRFDTGAFRIVLDQSPKLNPIEWATASGKEELFWRMGALGCQFPTL